MRGGIKFVFPALQWPRGQCAGLECASIRCAVQIVRVTPPTAAFMIKSTLSSHRAGQLQAPGSPQDTCDSGTRWWRGGDICHHLHQLQLVLWVQIAVVLCSVVLRCGENTEQLRMTLLILLIPWPGAVLILQYCNTDTGGETHNSWQWYFYW